ncbi:MAG: exodeoxyribonuclease VII small subunit [Clostridia bacterium]|nr:exodeoxyribonuclease VII small subunit [Clostridia bacterium]
MAKKKMNFEEAMIRLKEITETLERGGVTLEESIKLFTEGTELSAFCYETLQNAEQKITELSGISTGEDK